LTQSPKAEPLKPSEKSWGSKPKQPGHPNGVEVELPVEEVQVGDIVVVRPGEKIPVDGTVMKATRQ
jgi:cation transport ATPase